MIQIGHVVADHGHLGLCGDQGTWRDARFDNGAMAEKYREEVYWDGMGYVINRIYGTYICMHNIF